MDVSYDFMLKKGFVFGLSCAFSFILAWQCTSHSWGITKMYFEQFCLEIRLHTSFLRFVNLPGLFLSLVREHIWITLADPLQATFAWVPSALTGHAGALTITRAPVLATPLFDFASAVWSGSFGLPVLWLVRQLAAKWCEGTLLWQLPKSLGIWCFHTLCSLEHKMLTRAQDAHSSTRCWQAMFTEFLRYVVSRFTHRLIDLAF